MIKVTNKELSKIIKNIDRWYCDRVDSMTLKGIAKETDRELNERIQRGARERKEGEDGRVER